MKKIAVLICLYSLAFAGGQSESYIDAKHHLEWQDTAAVENELKWAMSGAYCRSLKLLGQNDWRLPTREELKTIIKMVQTPQEGRRFHYGTTEGYWTSEEDTQDDVNAWAIYMKTGHLFSSDKCDTANMRCVRTSFKK
ncbi:DUF1566 domain-containing protein [Sulfurimonas sp. HSL3-2]|uniref:Lcl C-terminal domain-containing protein n=1 Tax=Hydrocurvibacter mobilis TaxID=3131936 RepID=UPI0031F8DEEE